MRNFFLDYLKLPTDFLLEPTTESNPGLISQRIIKVRRRMGLTQEEFAKKLNTSREMVNYWENGKRLINIGDIINLAKMTGISTDWLLGFDVPPLSYSDSAEDCRKTHLEELMGCLAELCKYASDVNPEEIASHIATDNLGEWTKAWGRSFAKVLDKAATTTKQLYKGE